jgi:S1-C subfamily serine protease
VVDAYGMSPRRCTTPTDGTLIDSTQQDGPAAQAGLVGGEPLVAHLGYVGGDVIVSLDGHPIPDTDVLTAELVAQYSPRDLAQVGVVHCNGTQAVVPVTLGSGAP